MSPGSWDIMQIYMYKQVMTGVDATKGAVTTTRRRRGSGQGMGVWKVVIGGWRLSRGGRGGGGGVFGGTEGAIDGGGWCTAPACASPGVISGITRKGGGRGGSRSWGWGLRGIMEPTRKLEGDKVLQGGRWQPLSVVD